MIPFSFKTKIKIIQLFRSRVKTLSIQSMYPLARTDVSRRPGVDKSGLEAIPPLALRRKGTRGCRINKKRVSSVNCLVNFNPCGKFRPSVAALSHFRAFIVLTRRLLGTPESFSFLNDRIL